MKVLPHSIKNSKGFTLIELLIALAASLLLVIAAYATYIAQNRSYNAQEDVSEINTQSKVAADMIANDIRASGFGLPEDLAVDSINGRTTKIVVLDSTNSTDAITILGGFRQIGTLAADAALGSNTITINNTSGITLNTNDKKYINIDGVTFAEITAINGNTLTLDRGLDQDFSAGRPVYLVEDVTYCVDASGNLRRIRRNANMTTCSGNTGSDSEIIAQNIEDLQFAFAEDLNGDGLLDANDDQDGDNDFDGDDFIDGSSVSDFSQVLAVRINVLARAEKPDPSFRGLGNPPSSIENRAHAATNDSYRRRWWQSVVALRNKS